MASESLHLWTWFIIEEDTSVLKQGKQTGEQVNLSSKRLKLFPCEKWSDKEKPKHLGILSRT